MTPIRRLAALVALAPVMLALGSCGRDDVRGVRAAAVDRLGTPAGAPAEAASRSARW
jgi:hypothetical protein